MNVRLLLTMCLFLYVTLQAQQAQTLSDLKKGDWFAVEYIHYYSSPEGNQSLRNADIFEYLITVSDRTINELQLEISPTRVCSYKTFYAEKEKLLKDTDNSLYGIRSGSINGQLIFNKNKEVVGIIMPGKNFRSGFMNYSDSYINAELHEEDNGYWGERDYVTFNLNLNNGTLSDTIYHLEKEEWQYPRVIIEDGIRSENNFRQKTTVRIDPKLMFDDMIRKYFANCEPGAALPQYIKGDSENNDIYSIQITKASFALAPNVKLSFHASEKLALKDLFLEINSQKYDLQQDDNGMIRYELYLPHPARGMIANTSVSITPGDSVHIEKDSDGNVIFTGTGAENCRFGYELSKHQAFLDQASPFKQTQKNPLQPEEKVSSGYAIEQYLATGDSIFQTLLNQYAVYMSPYWLESALLSSKYWYLYKSIEFQRYDDFEIDWKKDPLQSVTPLIDYVYQPLYYTLSMNSYCKFKIRETYNDVFTADYSDNLLSKYYFQKEFFSGYPKYLELSETLLALMKSSDLSLSDFQKEYDHFITACKYPDLLLKVTHEYNLLSAVQPGVNIRELHLKIEKELPLKKSADGYILIFMGYLGNKPSNELLIEMMDSLNNHSLNTKVQVVYPERYHHQSHIDSTSSKGWSQTITSDDLRNDIKALRGIMNTLLLIRNDGAIVAKNIDYNVKQVTTTDGNKRVFQADVVRSLIKDDMERNKKTGFDFSILSVIFVTVILSGGIAYIVYSANVRAIRKKEENKRLISELELKAIRSQMNPHFIFNALNSIQHLIDQGKNSDANQYLLHFSKLLRMVLATSEKKLVSLSEEIEQLELYLQLEQLRMPFEYRIDVDPSIQPANEELPGMLIQPIVENAVKHGVNGKQSGTITVHFSKEGPVLLVEIADNGAGVLPSSLSMNGFGLKATEERLRLINKELKANIGIRMEHNHPAGTKVIISI